MRAAVLLLGLGACAPVVDVTAPSVDDRERLLLCDEFNTCEPVGQLVLLVDENDKHEPFHYVPASREELEAAEVDPSAFFPAGGSFNIRCRLAVDDIYACHRGEVIALDLSLRLMLCTSTGCRQPPHMVMVTGGGSKGYRPFGWWEVSTPYAISRPDNLATLANAYGETFRYDVRCEDHSGVTFCFKEQL